MTTRALVLTLALLLPACSDDAGSDSTGDTTAAPELGLYEPCLVDEPFSGLPSVDFCKEGLACSFDEYGCNQGLCALRCELPDSGAPDPCPMIEGLQSQCRFHTSDASANAPRACLIPCGPGTVCPQLLAKPMSCVASYCSVPVEECGVNSGET